LREMRFHSDISPKFWLDVPSPLPSNVTPTLGLFLRLRFIWIKTCTQLV
jgi:hypothetical protein